MPYLCVIVFMEINTKALKAGDLRVEGVVVWLHEVAHTPNCRCAKESRPRVIIANRD
jgi:hypothetical protein